MTDLLAKLILWVCSVVGIGSLITITLMIWCGHFPNHYARHKARWMDMWLFGKVVR
jgi:hypothetical protein